MLTPLNLTPPVPPVYPARLLISRAWNLSGIVAREFETVNGTEGSDGLFLLNELLEFKSVDVGLIPYYKRFEIQLIQGQEKYFIPGLTQLETFTFNIGEVRFPTFYSSRHHYFGDGRVDNITALPFEWHLERCYGGSNLYVYFLPEANYLAKGTGKFALTDVTLDTNMASVYDGFYLSYLRYSLAQYMDLEYDIEFPEDKLMKLKEMEKKLKWVSPPDFTMRKITFLNNNQPFNWAHCNISPAWNVG